MADILRSEVDDKLIMTHRDNGLINTFETSVYLITDFGLVWLSRYFSIGLKRARDRHEMEIQKERLTKTHYCSIKGCSDEGHYRRTTQTWLCNHHFTVWVAECV